MMALFLCAAAFVFALWRLDRGSQSLWVRLSTSVSTFVFLVLTATWFVADAFTDEGVNGAVIYHLRTGFGGAGIGEYAMLVAAFALAVTGALALAVWVYWRGRRGPPTDARRRGASLALGLVLLCLLHPTVNATLRDFSYALYGPESVLETALGAEPAGASFDTYYRQPRPVWPSSQRRNLVVIYAESLEQTYFDEELFPGLITELRALQDQAVAFTNIRTAAGTGFTVGGIVASQCGLPLITTGHPNSMRGMDRFLSGAVCIGDLLKEQDYVLHYLGGAKLSFAGKGTFFESHGFDSVMGLEELQPLLEDPAYVSTWGLYDDSLFEVFLDRFDELSREGQPFALFGLTMDTHHPSGHQSRSCRGLEYGDGSNPMLNAVRCADHLLAKTLETLLSSPAADNTLVVLASDHLALKNDAYAMLRKGTRRNLLWVFSPDQEPQRIDHPGTAMDTSVALLRGLGARIDEFALGRDLSQGRTSLVTAVPRIDRQLHAWREDFAGFWELPGEIEQLILDPETMTVQVNERRFSAPALLALEDGRLESIQFEFDFRRGLYEYVQDLSPETTFLWFDECRRVRSLDLDLPPQGNCYFAGKMEGRRIAASPVAAVESLDIGALRAVENSFGTAKLDRERRQRLEAFAQYGVADVRRRAVSTGLLESGRELRVRSSGGPRTSSALAWTSHQEALKRGIQLFEIGSDGAPTLIAHYDLCRKEGEVEQTPEALVRERSAATPGRSYLLIAHDSSTCGAPLAPLLEGLPITEWTQLGVRQPYVALFAPDRRSESLEFIGERYSQLRVTLTGRELVAAAGQLAKGS